MHKNTRETLRAHFPHLSERELQEADENLTRYARLAVEIVSAAERESTPLTAPEERGSVSPGTVDPGTFTNTR